jgi:phage repressor protein C with HTH and peptisase S24 domain
MSYVLNSRSSNRPTAAIAKSEVKLWAKRSLAGKSLKNVDDEESEEEDINTEERDFQSEDGIDGFDDLRFQYSFNFLF